MYQSIKSTRAIAQLGRAPRLHREGLRFKSV
nr:tRNA-Val [Aganope dinghuensis]